MTVSRWVLGFSLGLIAGLPLFGQTAPSEDPPPSALAEALGASPSGGEEILKGLREEALQRATSARPSSPRFDKLATAAGSRAGRAFGWAAWAADLAEAAGAASAGDKIGVLQGGTHVLLGGAAAAKGAALFGSWGAALGPLGGLVGAGLGAVLGGVTYAVYVKPTIDRGFDALAEEAAGLQAQAQRRKGAAGWMREAEELVAEAERLRAEARATMNDLDTRAATTEAERQLERIRPFVQGARASCAGAVSAGVVEAGLRRVRAAVASAIEAREDAIHYRTETCALPRRMSPVSQPDALRIWNDTGQYLAPRAASSAERTRQSVELAEEEWNRVEEQIQAARRAEAEALEAQLEIGFGRDYLDLEVAASLQPALDRLRQAAVHRDRAQDLVRQTLTLLTHPLIPERVRAERLQPRIDDLGKLSEDERRARELESQLGSSRDLEPARAQLQRWEESIQACSSFDLDDSLRAAVRAELAEARDARIQADRASSSAEECALQARTLTETRDLWKRGRLEDEVDPCRGPRPELQAALGRVAVVLQSQKLDGLEDAVRSVPVECPGDRERLQRLRDLGVALAQQQAQANTSRMREDVSRAKARARRNAQAWAAAAETLQGMLAEIQRAAEAPVAAPSPGGAPAAATPNPSSGSSTSGPKCLLDTSPGGTSGQFWIEEVPVPSLGVRGFKILRLQSRPGGQPGGTIHGPYPTRQAAQSDLDRRLCPPSQRATNTIRTQ